MGLKFKIVYKKGIDNIAADALSRVGHMMAMQSLVELLPSWLQEVMNSYSTDLQAQALLAQLAIHSPNEEGYTLQQGIIYLNNTIWIGSNSALQTKLIAALHSTAIGGHSGIQATYHRVKNLFSWKGLKADVENFVKQCGICQQAKHGQQHPSGLHQPLPIPTAAWQDISMDFIEGLPTSDHNNAIMVIVDRLTKYAQLVPVKHPYTASSIARLFLDNVVKLHGLPKTIVSDRDPVFISSFWRELFKLYEVKLTMSTAYHPQTDGQTKRVNQCLEMYLRCAIHESLKQWKSWLPLAELWYNSAYHTSLGCSPFKALYACEPNLVMAPPTPATTPVTVAEMIHTREQHYQHLKDHLLAAQNRMKLQADKKRIDLEFQVGDQVLLNLQPYVQTSVVNRPYPKLSFKYYGPFEVLKRIGQVAYQLKLPDGAQIHPVFHISQLKPFTADYTPVYSELPKVSDLFVVNTYPELIMDRRLVKRGNMAIPQVKIKWFHLPEAAATWEDYNVLKTRFPLASAWGQAGSLAGGVVTPVLP